MHSDLSGPQVIVQACPRASFGKRGGRICCSWPEAGVWASLGLLVVLMAFVVIASRDRVLVSAARGAQRVVDVVLRDRGPHDVVAQAIRQRDLLRVTIRRRPARAVSAAIGQA